MKKLILLFIALFLTTAAVPQNCNFTHYPQFQINVVAFTPNQNFTSPLFHFAWSFGDGDSSADSVPVHTYNNIGIFTACCTVYDTNNAIVCSSCDTIDLSNVIGACSYGATALSSDTYLFSAQITTGTSAVWDFGDGGNGTGNSIPHTYLLSGTYTVCMDEYDNSSGIVLCTYCSNVHATVSSAPCTFTYLVDSSSNSVTFSASVDPAADVLWDFGDNSGDSGVTSTQHVYNGTGPYNVCMTSSTDGFITTCSFCAWVTPSNSSSGNCSFTYTVDTVNRIAVFFAQPSSSASSISWNFGNGDTAVASVYTYLYPSPGVYYVCMTERDFFGTIVCTSCDSVVIGATQTSCSFFANPNVVNSGLIYFGALPSSNNTAITWDFGDNSSGSGYTPQHLYATGGTFLVCMNEVDVNTGVIVCSSCSTITVVPNTPSCQPYFIAVNLGLTGYFIDLSNLNPSTTTYSWDFGDNSVSSNRFPNHTYSLPGTYNVCLSVSTTNGCTDQYCSFVTVDTTINSNPSCQAYFVAVQMAPFQFVVVNLSNGSNLNFSWDFGDGSPVSNLPYPSHYYATHGSYDLCLTVSNSSCNDTYCDTLSVDSLGNIFRAMNGFTVNVVSPTQLTGINEISSPKLFSVYPNPVTSMLHVSIANEVKGVLSYKVFAVDGTEVTGGVFSLTDNRLNTANWNAGAYILEVRSEEGYKSYQKIIKE